MLEIQNQNLGDISLFKLRGRIMIGDTDDFVNAILSQSGARTVVIDMAHVSGIDAHGLGVLLDLRQKTESKGIEFKIMNIPRTVGQILEITCLNTVFAISSEDEVLSEVVN